MVKIRTFKLNPDLFRTTFRTFPDFQSFYPFKSLISGNKCQKWQKTVKNDQTTNVFTYKCSKLYFEPFHALLLVTYPIIHPQAFPFPRVFAAKELIFQFISVSLQCTVPSHLVMAANNPFKFQTPKQLSVQITNCLKQQVNSFPLDKLFLSRRIFVHRHSPPHII